MGFFDTVLEVLQGIAHNNSVRAERIAKENLRELSEHYDDFTDEQKEKYHDYEERLEELHERNEEQKEYLKHRNDEDEDDYWDVDDE